MRIQVIPMSSGEFDVQLEQSAGSVRNTQVPPPEEMLRSFPQHDPRRVVTESVGFLLERRDAEDLGHFVSLDELWRSDDEFAREMRARLR